MMLRKIGIIKTTLNNSRSILSILVLGLFLSATFFILNENGHADDITPPYVVSSHPADGATNVSVNLSEVSITFSEEMHGSSSHTTEHDFWGPIGAPAWSQDMRTLTIPRISQDPIPIGVTIKFTVWNLYDVALNPLEHPINPPAPEPGGIYTHALDRYSLLTDAVIDGKSIARVDLQLIAMRYPVGIANVETLSGTAFDLSTFRNVPQYIYVGDLDRNDALDTRGFPQDEVDAICALLDCRPEPYISDRWPLSEQMYREVNVFNKFITYPGVAHTISNEMFNDLFLTQFYISGIPVSLAYIT